MTEKQNKLKVLKCIQFPGVVANPDKAIECLGGISVISKACASSKGCLELNFRPKDPFSKAAISTVNETTGLLLKVRIKKKKFQDEGISNSHIISTEILGITHEVYSFQTLVDFQYVPIESPTNSDSDKRLKCILYDIIPPTITDVSWLDKPSPYFLPPPIFSRMTLPSVYSFNGAVQNEVEPELKNIISKLRKSRSNFAHYVNYSQSDQIPTKPKRQAVEQLKNDFENPNLRLLQKAFEEKPIRGRIELRQVTNIPYAEIKILLSVVAYNYINGPWRGLWAKFGYDPRKDPRSRIWQCIDYRIKALTKYFQKDSKKNFSFTPVKDGRIVNKRIFAEINADAGDLSQDERHYVFRPDVMPIKTQTFYQFCHIYVPEIEEMLSNLVEVLPGALCHDKRGWLPAGFHEQCRNIMFKHTSTVVKKLFGNKQSQKNDDILLEDAEEDIGESLVEDDDEEMGDAMVEDDFEVYSDIDDSSDK